MSNGQQGSDDGILKAPLVIEYPFKRTTGPVIGAFLTGLREQVLIGSRAEDGRVIVPPAEFDPVSVSPAEAAICGGNPTSTCTTSSTSHTTVTLEAVEVEEKWVPFFKTGKELRERLNGKA